MTSLRRMVMLRYPMRSIKLERIENQLRKEISNILQYDVKNSKFGFVTVSDVELTNDYSYATVYVSFLNMKDIHSMDRLEELNRVKGFVRSEVAKRLKIRKTPEIIFKIDDSIDTGMRIEKILDSVKLDIEKE